MVLLGKNLHGKAGSVNLIVGRNDQYQSPLGGGMQPATWVTRRQASRRNANANTHFLVNLRPYISKSSSFGGVGGMYSRGGGRGAAFRRGLYVHH